MSIPVSSLNGARLAAIADVGAVFSEMKFSVVPENCFHSPARGFDLDVAAGAPAPRQPSGHRERRRSHARALKQLPARGPALSAAHVLSPAQMSGSLLI